jgi:hypothetical protein
MPLSRSILRQINAAGHAAANELFAQLSKAQIAE